jgi:hypothetical protein
MSSRNNQQRLGNTDASGVNSETENNNNQLSFSVPTEFVDLPSKGLYYPENHPLHGVDSVEIKHMTAKEEDILASESLIRKGVAIDRMLQSLLIDNNLKVKDLLVGDKNALTVAARITGYGTEYTTRVTCPACNTVQEFEFDLEEQTTIGAAFDRDQLNESLEGVEMTSNGTFLVELPKSGLTVELKMLTGADEEKLEKFQKQKAKNNNGQSSLLTDTMKSIIIAVDKITERDQINNFVENMPALDSRYLRGIYQQLVPNIDMTQEFSCKKCDHTQALEVPVTTDFFWPQQ